jgi:hypothetical protein
MDFSHPFHPDWRPPVFQPLPENAHRVEDIAWLNRHAEAAGLKINYGKLTDLLPRAMADGTLVRLKFREGEDK